MSGNETILARMRTALDQHLTGSLPVTGLVSAWRQEAGGLALPPVFGQTMEELLRRLEMSASFAQESCSFSASAVTDQLKRWLDKAGTV